MPTIRTGTAPSPRQSSAPAWCIDSTAGNPNGKVNYDRTEQVADGAQFTKSRGYSIFAQDTFQWDKLVVNAGLRVERFVHFNTLGEVSYRFP